MAARAARLWRRAVAPPERPALTAGPVSLVPVAEDHFEGWADAAASCEAYLRRWQPTWPDDHLGRQSYERRLAIYERDWRRGTGEAYHVIVEDRIEGMLRLSSIQRGAAQSCDVGYWIAKRASGRGYATAALSVASDHALRDLDLSRIEATCAVGNEASLRVLTKAGFAFEGIARAYLALDGVRQDHHRLARIAD